MPCVAKAANLGDFDEEREGDGIGETARAIPGGTAADNFPLAEAPQTRWPGPDLPLPEPGIAGGYNFT